ncbi:TetR/AcrR family transcriptional regulator [Paenibacillus aquistagni]|uniref:TetR/AcrR family transcriptional regulator n=1 Tax=Paenibacillus aquistagni TaxID=1852522 RepID=UPI000B503E03|nr:TetR/AcrR family transcriptional regulator [Paenibacillus aquistagni]
MNIYQGDKLEIILEAAFDLFGSQGYYATKMSDIAEKAGIAKGTLYLYFTSKEDLFATMYKRDMDAFLLELSYGIKRGSTLGEQLSFVAEHYLGYYYERRQYTKFFFKEPNNDPAVLQIYREFMINYVDIVSECMAASQLPTPISYAKGYVGILTSMKMDMLFDESYNMEDMKEAVRFSTQLFLNGCRQDTHHTQANLQHH